MIVLQHHDGRVQHITLDGKALTIKHPNNIAQEMKELADAHPEYLLVWCDTEVYHLVQFDVIPSLTHHRRMVQSYGGSHFLNPSIGYIEESPFVTVSKKVCYATWQLHATVGVMHASVLRLAGKYLKADRKFDYFLTSFAKCLMPQGLFCYSNPNLLSVANSFEVVNPKNMATVFRFVKQHYKTRWTFFLLLCFIWYEKQWPICSFLKCQFYKRRQVPKDIMADIPLQSQLSCDTDFTLDVVIPTIGRKPYLYDVLKDLAVQTVKPVKVIVIEQNPDEGSKSELDYLYSEDWPFQIKHIFTHQTGACHSRNLGLQEVESHYVFLADDDIRFENNLLERTMSQLTQHHINATTMRCLREKERASYGNLRQWHTFGSGCSVVSTAVVKQVYFNLAYEHGFGEDADFGMQLRNIGADVIYLPTPSILHLKAPVGGFRTKFKQPWFDESIAPKPSPTVMLFKLLHQTKQQLKGYQLRLLMHQLKQHKPMNVFGFVNKFQKAWANSLKWAYYLKSVK